MPCQRDDLLQSDNHASINSTWGRGFHARAQDLPRQRHAPPPLLAQGTTWMITRGVSKNACYTSCTRRLRKV